MVKTIECGKAKNGKEVVLKIQSCYLFKILIDNVKIGYIEYNQAGIETKIYKIDNQKKGYGTLSWIYFADYLFSERNLSQLISECTTDAGVAFR